MLVSTMNDVPGYQVDKVIGEVTGLTVRARNLGTQIGAGLKSVLGGELKGLTKQLQQSRDEAVDRMTELADSRGANAVLAVRFDSDEVGNGYQDRSHTRRVGKPSLLTAPVNIDVIDVAAAAHGEKGDHLRALVISQRTA